MRDLIIALLRQNSLVENLLTLTDLDTILQHSFGHSRILSEKEYEWVSDPNEALPQWLEVKFKERTSINYISLVFDTDMTNPGTCFGFKFEGVPVCVKKYDVDVFDGENWIRVADVEENFMRKCNHTFDTINAEKIRVNVHSTWGDRSARITEIRAAFEE